MKNISLAMAAHLKQDVTTLTTCWLITRLDGKVYGFTEHDEDIVYNDVLYKTNGGFNKSAMKNSATFSVDNLEVNGFLTDDTIDDTELRNGAFDYAQAEIFLINYMDHSMGTIKLRFGYFGEVRSAPSGAFLVELRGLVQLLAQKIGEVYTPECRADFGDSRCKVKVETETRRGNKKYFTGERMIADITGASKPPVGAANKNLNFDYNSGPDLEWGKTIYDSIVEGTLFVQPQSPGFMGRVGGGYLELPVPLVTGPITADVISTGELKLKMGAYFNSIEEGQQPQVMFQWFVASNPFGSIEFKTETYDLAAIIPPRTWLKKELTVDIPDRARSVRITFSVGSFPQFGVADMGLDTVSIDIIRPDSAFDFRRYGGVEWVAGTTGTTAANPPVFTADIGSTVIDGGVEWLCVAPNHMFLDTVRVDATDSSILYLDSVDKPDGWFDWGVIKILTGENAGIAVEPMSWDNDTKKIKLSLPLPHKTLAGTYVQLISGCDKTRPVCLAKFDNLLNFRGEPDVPGINRYFKVAGVE